MAQVDFEMLGLRHVTTGDDGTLSKETLPDMRGYSSPVIRIDPDDGRLVVVAASYDKGIVVATKP